MSLDYSTAFGHFIVRSERRVRIGPLRIVIRSNEKMLSAARFLPDANDDADETGVDHVLNFCNLEIDPPWNLDDLARARDRVYRGERFAAGYYITDHFGAPAYLITQYPHYWVFGSGFDRILWPYFVKLLLTLHSMEHRMLHLKAAAVAVDGAGTLLVGRGGSGKTVLLTQMCKRGAHFLSNTHSLIDGRTLLAVPSAMRVRRDSLFTSLISTQRLQPAIKPGEYLAHPDIDLQWPISPAAPLENICLVDYRGPTRNVVREMDRRTLYNYLEQFSLALNVYGLKEDLLDHLGGDLARFSMHMDTMRSQLQRIVEQCRPVYVSCDAMSPTSLDAVHEILRH